MKLSITLKDFKNNIIGYFNTNKQKNLLEDLNYRMGKVLIYVDYYGNYNNANVIYFPLNNNEIKYDLFTQTNSPSIESNKYGLSGVKDLISISYNNNVITLTKNNALNNYDVIYIINVSGGKYENLTVSYKYNNEDPIVFAKDGTSSMKTSVFIYKDKLYAVECYDNGPAGKIFSDEFNNWFNDNFK